MVSRRISEEYCTLPGTYRGILAPKRALGTTCTGKMPRTVNMSCSQKGTRIVSGNQRPTQPRLGPRPRPVPPITRPDALWPCPVPVCTLPEERTLVCVVNSGSSSPWFTILSVLCREPLSGRRRRTSRQGESSGWGGLSRKIDLRPAPAGAPLVVVTWNCPRAEKKGTYRISKFQPHFTS